MSWAEIKKAINSTLGTNNFKPLNEIFQDSMVLYASDNSIANYTDANAKVKVNYSGTCRIKAVVKGSTYSISSGAALVVYINNNNSASYSITFSDTGVTRTFTPSLDINVSKGDTISVGYTTGSGVSITIQSWSLCGMIGLGGVIAETTS